MSKLKKFSKSNGKNNTIKLIVAFLLVAVVSAAISYAVYQKEDEVLFINARVGHFEESSSDIELAMKLDGEDIDTPPSKGYYNVTVECDHAKGRWDEEEWGAVITNISSNRVKCNVNFETLNGIPLSIVEIGDYISMTPTSTSYTPPSELTGCMNDSNCTQNTLNPSELNLWRVIRKNEDGTVDAVSEYVSSTVVYFRGQTGYLNLVGGLNTIAAQYTNEKYVSKTRHMGYSNQKETCTGTLSYNDNTTCPSDTGYTIDTNLVQEAIGTLAGNLINGSKTHYFLSSRDVYTIGGYSHFYTRYELSYGGQPPEREILYSHGNTQGSYTHGYAIRPILTLKSRVLISSGDGKSAETAYQLN